VIQKYFEQGYVAIPVYRNGKNPAIGADWQRWCTERPSLTLVESWDDRVSKQKMNIGITCGPASGIVVVDIDVDDEKIMQLCPPSFVRRRGAKGEARVFKYAPNVQSVSLPGLDLLSTGRQFLVPPSIHPTTHKPYVWLTENTLENTPVDELPELDLSFLELVRPLLTRTKTASVGRNNKLVDIISAMRGRGEEESAIVREVYEWDRDHHSPRLFFDPKESFRAKNEAGAMSSAMKLVNSVTKSLLDAGMVTILDNRVVIDINDSPAPKSEKFKPKTYPQARGIMGKFIEYCDLTSSGKQDALGLGGAISLMSVLCSNRFNTEVRGLTTCPNLYVINLAHSSFGKETAQRVVYDLLTETDSGLLGGASYRSGSSIVMSLPKQQERLDLIDECSSLLKAMGGKEDYKSEIVEILSSLYSKSNSKFLGFSSLASGDKYGACWNPCISLLGSTTPAGFRASVNRDMAAKGLLPRFFLFIQSDLGAYKGRQDRARAEALYRELEAFILGFLALPKREHPTFKPQKNLLAKHSRGDHQDLTEGVRYDPFIIPLTEEAHEYWLTYDEECHYRKAENPEGFESAFIGRFAEKVAKLALLDALSMGRERVELDNVQWARRVVEAEWHNSMPLYELAAAENQFAASLIQILKVVESKGRIGKSDLLRRFSIPAKTFWGMVDQLVEQGSVIYVVDEKGTGKPGPKVTYVQATLQKTRRDEELKNSSI